MVHKISGVANAMIGESCLPNFSTSEFKTERMGVSALDQLHRPLERHAEPRRNQQMNMLRHQHEGMQLKSPLPLVAVQDLQEESDVRVYDKQPSAFPG